MSSIASRTSELTIHTKTVLAATKEAEKAAKSIRLETAKKVIHSATEAVRDLASLRTAVSGTANEQALSTKIDRAVKSINDLVPLVMAVRGDD